MVAAGAAVVVVVVAVVAAGVAAAVVAAVVASAATVPVTTAVATGAFGFVTSVGRFVGAGITFLVGAGVSYYHTIGTPVALTSLAFLVGLLLLPFGKETKGAPLPA